MSQKINKFALGTVQFGINYGISNTHGQVTQSGVKEIIDVMYANGGRTLDTAQAYGTSEEVLGKCGVVDFDVITKVKDTHNITDSLNESLEKINISQFEAVMYHSFSSFKDNEASFSHLQKAKEDGITRKIGFSLYNPKEAEYLLSKYKFDIVQVPYNLFDRRFELVFEKLKSNGVEIHVRSVYLQGLFFLDPDKLPIKIAPLTSKLREFREIVDGDIARNCVSFVNANPYINKVVMGCTTLSELKQNMGYFTDKDYPIELNKLSNDIDPYLINPSNW